MRHAAAGAVSRTRGQRALQDQHHIEPALRTRIRRKLLRWYDRNRRDLPWRHRAHDPYAQWVAEIMLQQTRVETVLAYYDRFLRRFPDIAALAVADHEDVVKRWEGLGYYRRILHLHRAAKLIHERGGGVPTSAAELQRLPGVGAYTAAAIASIAFGEKAAAVDGNVARVLARLFGVTCDVLSTPGKRRIHDLATQLLAPGRPGDFNQAWMDLGSSTCTPRSPHCARCPLKADCVATRTGCAASLPHRGTSRNNRRPKVDIVVGIFVHKHKVLMQRRPTGGLWSSLWEFPNFERNDAAAPARLVRRLASDNNLRITARLRRTATVKHELSHRSLTFHVYVTDVELDPVHSCNSASLRWVTGRGLRRLAISTAYRKILAASPLTPLPA